MRKLKIGFALLAVLLLGACSTHAKQSLFLGSDCGCDFVANVGDRVFFAFSKSQLTVDARDTLKTQADWLAKYPNVHVLVAGNADERGTETYNLALGAKRADAARDQLLVYGVAAARVTTISYGKDCPVAADHDEAAYQQNRNAITSVQGFNPQKCH